MKTTRTFSFGSMAIGIAALFLAGFLLLVFFGAGSYRNTVAGEQRSMDARALLGYLATTLKGGDRAGAVEIRRDPAVGTVLVIGDEDLGGADVYALRIYLEGGDLVEDYAPADAPLRPEDASVIGETGTFTVTKNGGTLTLSTDAGTVTVFLRSEGGAAR